MKQEQRNQRVIEITSAWLDGLAGDDELKELNELLHGDPEACELYLNLTEAHAGLTHKHANSPLPEQIPQFTKIERAVTSKRALSPLAMAALFTLLGLIAYFVYRPSPVQPELTAEGGIAVLSRLIVSNQDIPYTEGDTLNAGIFEIGTGLAQIEFFSGAGVIVEGPAKLKLESAWKAQCLAGRLQVSVPDAAHGFTIDTPQYRAVDLGTEFAIAVNADGQSEIHVVDGEVRLDDFAGNELRRLTTGNGIRSTDVGGSFEEVSNGGSGFVNRKELLTRTRDDWRSSYQAWSESRQSLRTNKNLLVHYDFESQNLWDRQLSNRMGTGANGAIIGARWTEGQWPGKGALEFKRITDRVRLQVPGEFNSLTLCARVRIEGFDQWLSSLLLTDGFEAGEPHWQISDKGELILGIAGAKPLNQFSMPVIQPRDLGRWINLAVTVNRESGTVIHYLDGQIVSTHKDVILPMLRIGAAEVGNWNSGNKTGHSIRSLNGRMEELLIFDRALTASEIAALE